MRQKPLLPDELAAAWLADNPSPSRRRFLQASGAIIVSLGSGLSSGNSVQAKQASAGPYPDPNFLELDTWIVIHADNTATFFVGKTDGGQGTGTAFRQIMCDELDIPFDSTQLVMGSTDRTPDQGGSGGSDALERDGWPMRRVAAEARRVLVEQAAEYFDEPVNSLMVRDARIAVGNSGRSVTYAELVGGKRFDVALSGANVDATTGRASIKPVNELRVVGQSIQRYDIPPKVDGTLDYAVDVRLPGMVHARNVRPPIAGATLRAIDETSVADIPGLIEVIRRGNYVAVICEREEHAIRAAGQLKLTWDPPAKAPFPPSDDLFDYMRVSEPTSSDRSIVGDPEAAFARADRVIEASYEVPFQGHTAIGPAHALADPTNNQMTIYSNDMKSYGLRRGVAEFLGMPLDRVRVIYMEGPQVYGRTAADDAGFEAAFLAHTLGRPVRVQWSREEETVWDTKGPAYTFDLRGALDGDGNVIAFDYDTRAADYNHLWYNDPDTVLMAQLMGRRSPQPGAGRAATPANHYAIPNQRLTARVVSLPMIWETPLRMGNLRDPNGPQVTFAFESFIDELAAAANRDPLQFRLDLIAKSPEDDLFLRARSLATLRAAATSYGWEPRPAPQRNGNREGDGEELMGRGIAYTYRNKTVVATIVDVEVNARTGAVWVKRIVCAHDCGLIVNPDGLRNTVEGALMHALSRALWEEVQFDDEKVTSVDWISHPSLRHSDTPESIEVVLVNGDPNPGRPDLPPYGAGEASHKPVIAAVANAIFDATGVRLRRAPFRRTRVLAALREQA